MLKKLSTFQLLAVGVFSAGLLPLLIVAALSGEWVALLIGAALLALLAGGAAFWLSSQIMIPVKQITQIVMDVAESVEAEQTAAITPFLQTLENAAGGGEISKLAANLKQLARAIQMRLDEYNSIYAMGRVITTKLDFEQTVQAVLEAVKQVVVFDAAEVTVLRGEKLVVEAWTGQPEFNNTTGRQYRVGRGPTGMIASNRASVLVSTVQGNEEDLKRTLGYESAASEFMIKTTKVIINSFLGIPLLIEDRLIGTLTLVHRDPGRFTESDRRQLDKLAAQASIAIDNAVQVRQREDILKAQIRELRVEIDESRLNKEVEEITTSDYFQNLQTHAARMRKRAYDRGSKQESEPDETEPDSATHRGG
jgi:GAF domain-containing protein